MTTDIIYIFNENCVMAGRQVPMSRLNQYDDPSEGNDWSSYSATEEEAAYMAKKGAFGRKVAATIREYLR